MCVCVCVLCLFCLQACVQFLMLVHSAVILWCVKLKDELFRKTDALLTELHLYVFACVYTILHQHLHTHNTRIHSLVSKRTWWLGRWKRCCRNFNLWAISILKACRTMAFLRNRLSCSTWATRLATLKNYWEPSVFSSYSSNLNALNALNGCTFAKCVDVLLPNVWISMRRMYTKQTRTLHTKIRAQTDIYPIYISTSEYLSDISPNADKQIKDLDSALAVAQTNGGEGREAL